LGVRFRSALRLRNRHGQADCQGYLVIQS
jgi:hypothetical protein